MSLSVRAAARVAAWPARAALPIKAVSATTVEWQTTLDLRAITLIPAGAPSDDAGTGGIGGTAGTGAASGAAGAGGTHVPQAHVYATVTALYDAIDAAQIVNGDTWTVIWTADARVSAGSISGALSGGAPNPAVLDQGALPLKLFTAKDWVSSAPTGNFLIGTDGYPKLQVATDAVNDIDVGTKLSFVRYAIGRFTEARMRISQDLTGAADFTGVAFSLWDSSDQNSLIDNHFVEVGGGSMSVAIDSYAAGTQTLSLGSGASSTRIFDGFWVLTPATPFSAALTVTNQLLNLSAVVQGSKTATIPGQGDWSTNSGFRYSPGMRLFRARGGSGTSSAVGVTFSVQRYVP